MANERITHSSGCPKAGGWCEPSMVRSACSESLVSKMCVWYNVYGLSGFLGGSLQQCVWFRRLVVDWRRAGKARARRGDSFWSNSSAIGGRARGCDQKTHRSNDAQRRKEQLVEEGAMRGVRVQGVRCDMSLSDLRRNAATAMLVQMPLSVVSEVRRRQALGHPCGGSCRLHWSCRHRVGERLSCPTVRLQCVRCQRNLSRGIAPKVTVRLLLR